DVLQHACGHLEGTSLPIGGVDTHAVITAHRGLPQVKLFRELDKLEIGDEFYYTNVRETLAYQVDQILVVEPWDFEPVLVVEGKDLMTLLTCTPYMINSHRLLVRGHRVPYIEKKAKEFKDIIKMGRTELEDAVPTTLGNTFNAFASYIKSDIEKITAARESMTHLNMGATAIGTGINCHPEYKNVVVKKLKEITGVDFKKADDFIAATQDTADFVHVSGALKTAAVRLSKIANDLRLMNSGPRCGLGEINLPQMQPGSSIMPGKVNPVIAEVVGEACYEVIGNDVTIMLCSERGEFELNAFEPGIAYALFNSIFILENAMKTLAEKAIKKLTANPEACLKSVLGSVGIVTAFNPYIGYEKSASIAKEALQTGKAVGDICLERGYLSKEEIDKILEPKNMLNPSMVK
ncbi:MAG: class C sortase, partial [Campylobacter concisus]|nr:class C sortase [Campylobacter concisus]